MASALHWIPDSLYNTSISVVASNFSTYQATLKTFPENVLFDVYYKLYKEGRLCQLGCELSNLFVFERMLKVHDKRYLLHHCFQAIVDHSSPITRDLISRYKECCLHVATSNNSNKESKIKLGVLLGDFLSDAGWYTAAETVFELCLELSESLLKSVTERHFILTLECYRRLLHVRNVFLKLPSAEQTFNEAQMFVRDMQIHGYELNLAGLFSEFSAYYLCCSDYSEAYRWSVEALEEIATCKNMKVVVAVLNQASRACVASREFLKAELLIKQSLRLSRIHFGERHPIMADTLIVYGFYLMNADKICHLTEVYKAALEARQCIFGGQNLLVAIAHEDLAYAMYIKEYNTMNFNDAKEHVEMAIKIMRQLLPEDHLLLASSKRVKALILEEMALDNSDKTAEKRLLLEAQELHMFALHRALEVYGEMNAQTAKHYSNLGRLYQSMKNFPEARTMHLKALEIKEELLGPDDFEIGISLGHLASLYNYDMMLYDKAEELYLRSLRIDKKFFGEGYSGLEYPYRGLLRVYRAVGNNADASKYQDILQHWSHLRKEALDIESETSPLTIELDNISLENIFEEYLCTL